MKTREELKSKLENFDLSSLSDEKVHKLLKCIDGINSINTDLAEIELCYNEERWKDISNNSNDIVWTTDLEGNFTYVNPMAKKILNYNLEDEINLNIKNYLTPESYQIAAENIKIKLENETDRTIYEVEAISKDGRIVNLEINSTIKYKNGKPYEILGIARDISERIKSEEELNKIRGRYKELFEATGDIVYTIDLNGNFTSINPVAEKMFGAKIGELPGPNIKDVLTPESATLAVENIFKKTSKQKDNTVFEVDIKTKDGSKLIFEVNSFLRYLNEKPYEILGIARDVTERKLIENQLKSMLAEKEVLLREIHHRVKNNMQILISLINMQIQDFDNPLMINKFTDLQERVRTMSLIHEDLYMSDDLSKINFGNYLRSLSNNLIHVFFRNFEINIRYNIDNVFLNIDKAIPCGLIVNELLSNSLKYAFPEKWRNENKNKICEITIEFLNHENTYMLIIADNGIGMPDNKDKPSKSTLGLTLVEILVNQLRGSMHIHTQNGMRYEIVIDKN